MIASRASVASTVQLKFSVRRMTSMPTSAPRPITCRLPASWSAMGSSATSSSIAPLST